MTKRYLVRVCKKWYRLAYLFLYEWIFVGKLKNLQGLILTIEQFALDEPKNRILIGWYTKRLDINICLTGGEVMDYRSVLGSLLLRLLRNLDNLEVFVVQKCLDYTWLDPSVSHSWCPRLRVLNWIFEEIPESELLDAEVWVHFLRSHPHIIGMKPSITKPPKNTSVPPGFSHSLLSYNTCYMSPIPINSITSLRRLSINLREDWFIYPGWQDHFITRPLPSLTDLQLNLVYFHTGHGVDRDPSVPLSTVRGLMHQFMPNLQRIDLALPAWPAIWSEFIFPETVRVLGVRVHSKKPTRQLAKFLLQKLNEIVHHHHSSREPLVIHFLDRGTLDGILAHHGYLMRHARKANILERWIDCDGYEYKFVEG